MTDTTAKTTTITIPLPQDEKDILTDFCQKTSRTQTEIIRAFIRSLSGELPFHYGLLGCGGDPIEFVMRGGETLTEEEFRIEHPKAYLYWKMSEQQGC